MVPVITLDGPSGAGKGTLSRLLADTLGFSLLDSGALYRLTALAATRKSVALDDETALGIIARQLDIQFVSANGQTQVFLEREDVTLAIRTEAAGMGASQVAALPQVRAGLLERQRAFRLLPGLIADGRDMGTVVFPDATLKIFLTASADARAQRRYNQLLQQGLSGDLAHITAAIVLRDQQDSQRTVAPLRAADDAHVIDSTQLSIDQVLAQILTLWHQVMAP